MTNQERCEILSSNSMFSGLKESQLFEVAKSTDVFLRKEGEPIFKQGDEALNFFYVIEGEVKLFKISSAGNEKVFEIIRGGSFFAEATMFFDPPVYPVNSTALVDTQLMSIRSKVFFGILEESSSTCISLLGNMSMRLHKQINEINNLTLQNATFRVAGYLLSLSKEKRDNSSHDQKVHLSIPKRIIASRLSIQPETLSRILSKFDKQNLIDISNQDIIIKDSVSLRQLLSD